MDSPLPRPPGRWWIEGGNFGGPQRDKMAALIGVAANLRAVLAAHVTFQFMDGRRLWPAHNVQGHRLVGITTEAADLKIEISGVQCVAEVGRRLSRSFETQHALVPCDTRQTVSFLPGLGRALGRMPNRTAVNAFAKFGAHLSTMRQLGFDRQAGTDWARNHTTAARSWLLSTSP
jgi:hypothetical protein